MHHRRLRTITTSALMTLLMSVVPATAGTAEEPELRDPCALSDTGQVELFPPYQDICAAWLESSYDAEQEVTSLTVNLRMAGDVSVRPSMYYYVWWTAGGCSYGLTLTDDATAANSEAQLHPCTGSPLTLPAGAATIEGDTITWSISFDGPLATHQGRHGPGAVLSDIQAGAYKNARRMGFTMCVGRCVEFLGDIAEGQRDHTVPQPDGWAE